jgi:ribosome biogenesis GTPase
MVEQIGTVIKSTGSWYQVKTDNGKIYNSRLKGIFRNKQILSTNPIAVGDNVKISISEDNEYSNIIQIEPRRNCIVRKATNLSKTTHIIAANIDQSVLIVTLAYPRTSSGFIDRFLITAEAYHIPSVIVFNKIDLYDTEMTELLHEFAEIYEAASYKVICVSAKEGINMNSLKQILYGKVSLFSGHSGVGKSHILNMLEPDFKLKTGEISSYHLKGKHTTTFAEMHEMSFGATVIDTPGIKEFGLVDFEPWELGHWFPDFVPFIAQCKFSNCTHLNEPHCAVRNAVEEEQIHQSRYYNYLGILQNIEDENGISIRKK